MTKQPTNNSLPEQVTLHTALAAHFTNKPTVFATQQEASRLERLDKWKAQGEPHIWLKVEEARGYTCWFDVGYGYIAVTRGEALVDVSKRIIIGQGQDTGMVAFDRDYYGTQNYLFFASSNSS